LQHFIDKFCFSFLQMASLNIKSILPMKKIFYAFSLLFALATFTSCSDDNDSNNDRIVHDATGNLTLKINGDTRTFGSLKVIEERYSGYTDLVVKGTQVDDVTKSITVSLGKDKLGSDSIYFVQYINNGTHYQMGSVEVNGDITESNNSRIIGTFSGVLSTINMDNLILTDGILDITY